MKRILAGALAAVLCASCAPDVAPVDADWHTTAIMAGHDWRDEVVYQIITDRFADGDLANDYRVQPYALQRYQGGDWQGIIDHLGYLQDLGVTALWISPIIRNVETDSINDGYHGYWPQDFGHLNPHFGDLAKLRELVQDCHARGMKVILDVVVNDVGQLFFYDINGNGTPDVDTLGPGCAPQDVQNGTCTNPQISNMNEYDPPYDPLGVQGWSALGVTGPAQMIWLNLPDVDRMPALPGWNGADYETPSLQGGFSSPAFYHRKGEITDWNDREQVLTGDFPGGLKDLATDNPDVRAALTAVWAKWIYETDADGFRIDAVKHVEHGFFQYFCPRIRQYCAGTLALPDTTVKVAPGRMPPMVPALSVPKANFLQFGEVFDGDDDLVGSYTMNQELDSAVYFPQMYAVFNRVFKYGDPTSEIQTQYTLLQTKYGAAPNAGGPPQSPQDLMVNFIDNHDVARFLFDKPSIPALHNALAYLLTEPGIPCIYYGTEQDFHGGNDPQNRERLWDTGFAENGATFQWIRKLIQIREAYEPLRRGSIVVRWASPRNHDEQDAGIFAFERQDGGKAVLVVLNVSDTKQSETSASSLGGGEMMTSFAPGTSLTDVLAPPGDPAAVVTVDSTGGLTIDVPARGARIFVPTSQVVPLGR